MENVKHLLAALQDSANAGGLTLSNGGEERTFKSGSKGYFISGKMGLGPARYQVTINMTRIGSKGE